MGGEAAPIPGLGFEAPVPGLDLVDDVKPYIPAMPVLEDISDDDGTMMDSDDSEDNGTVSYTFTHVFFYFDTMLLVPVTSVCSSRAGGRLLHMSLYFDTTLFVPVTSVCSSPAGGRLPLREEAIQLVSRRSVV